MFKKRGYLRKQDLVDPYVLYQEGLDAIENNDLFFASKKFSQAELNFEIDLAAKSAIMSSLLWNQFL